MYFVRLAAVASLSCLFSLTVESGFAATVVITEEEAKLPPPKETPAPSDRGITRGPKIEMDADERSGLRAPFHLKLRFKAYGGSAIDLGTFQATYLKDKTIDLTSRLKPFVQETGVDVKDAQIPPGEHFIQIGIKDADGRAVTKTFKLKISP